MPTEAFSQAFAALGGESSEGGSDIADSVVEGAGSDESVETSTTSQSESLSEEVSEGAAGGSADSGREASAEAAPSPDEGAIEGPGPEVEWTPDGRAVPINRFQEVIAQRNDLREQMQQMQQSLTQMQQAQQVASFIQPQAHQQSAASQYGDHNSEDEFINSLLGTDSGTEYGASQYQQAPQADPNQAPQWATQIQSQFEQFQDYIGQQQLATTVKDLQSIYPNVPDWALYQSISVGMDPEQAAIQFQTWANSLSPQEAAAAGAVGSPAGTPMAAPRPQSAASAGQSIEGALSAADLADPKKRKNLALKALDKIPFP